MIDMSDPRSEHFGQMRHETLPADHLFGRRVEMLTLAVLVAAARARATGTGSRASGCTATTPVTELGRQEAAFYAALARSDLLDLEQARRAGPARRQAGGDADALAAA